MITLKSCPICGTDNITQLRLVGTAPSVLLEIMPGVKVKAGIISQYFLCQNRGLIFQNPRLSDSHLEEFYGQGYYQKLLGITTEQMDADEMYRAEINARIVKQRIGKVKSHLGIGCGRGYLLDKVGAGLKVGVEPNVDNITVKDVEAYSKISEVPQKSFDLVTAIHVLEHVPYPLDYLKKMAKLIKEGGFLIIEVPTWKSPGGPLRLPHLYHFEPDVLRLMCKEVGLRVVEARFTPHLLLICQPSS